MDNRTPWILVQFVRIKDILLWIFALKNPRMQICLVTSAYIPPMVHQSDMLFVLKVLSEIEQWCVDSIIQYNPELSSSPLLNGQSLILVQESDITEELSNAVWEVEVFFPNTHPQAEMIRKLCIGQIISFQIYEQQHERVYANYPSRYLSVTLP